MKKLITFFLFLLLFPLQVHADTLTNYNSLSLKLDQTINFNFIIASIDEEDNYELLEGYKIELNSEEYSGISNDHGIITIDKVPIQYTKLMLYDTKGKLIFTKNIIFSFGDRTKGYRYNSTAKEQSELLNFGLGYDEDDIKNGDLRMDIHLNKKDNSIKVFLATRMLGEGDNLLHFKIVLIFSLVLISFIFLYEKAMDIKKEKKI